MYTLLLILLILDSIVLVAAILLQSGKGGGLAASFGGATSSSDSFVGTRQAANLLTKTSWYGGGLWLALGLALSIMSTRQQAPRSVLDQPIVPPAQTAPAPSGGAGGTAVPLEPAPSKTAPAEPAPQKTPTPAPPTP
ncbi:MAG TPA: preprotein translocase subunit SecG [Gemmatimonadaceae bacterium]|nr:preprotein translocase subunit SecG [Gemmatimonadaceae bacterium]